VIENLIPNNPDHLETLLAADRVHNHVPMNANKMLAVENTVLVLAGGVDHLDGEVMVAVADHFAESVFDRRVVGVDEVPVDVLHCEGGFACDWGELLVLGEGWRRVLCFAQGWLVWEDRAYRLICCRRWPFCAVSAGEAWWWVIARLP
jgi:hypothetical protein